MLIPSGAPSTSPPDNQEEILFLPRFHGCRDTVQEKAARNVAAVPDLRMQWVR